MKWISTTGCIFLACAVLGCSDKRGNSTSVELKRQRAALLDPFGYARVLGFEALEDWSFASPSTATLRLSDDRTSGAHALELSNFTYVELISVPLMSSDEFKPFQDSPTISYRLKIPENQPNPWWYGSTHANIHVPSLGLYNEWLGAVDLTSLVPGEYSEIKLPVPDPIVEKLQGTFGDAQIKIVLNVPAGAGPYLLDAITPGTEACTCQASSPTGPAMCVPCPLDFTLQVPVDVGPRELALSSHGSMTLSSQARVTGASATISNAGTGRLLLGANAEVGNAWSLGATELQAEARVLGTLTTSGSATIAPTASVGTLVSGGFTQGTTHSFQVSRPRDTAGNLRLTASGSLAPGRYGTVEIGAGITVSLASGRYFFHELHLAAGAELRADTLGGPVFLYITDTLEYEGRLIDIAGQFDRVLVGYAGTKPVTLAGVWHGTLVAPSAKVSLEATPADHRGAVFAADIELEPGAVLEHHPFIGLTDLLRPRVAPTPTLTPVGPSVALTPSNVGEFVSWATRSPSRMREQVAEEVRKVSCTPGGTCNSDVLNDLFSIANDTSLSLGQRLVSLAVIGELRNPAAMARLLDLIQAPLPPEGLPQADVTRTPRTLAKMVRARAVQALAFLRTPTALSHTKNIAATHASRLIRAAAIDAFMFNRRNSAAARDELMAVVRPEEQRFIGLARKADVVDAASLAAFEQKISDYYATYPEELP